MSMYGIEAIRQTPCKLCTGQLLQMGAAGSAVCMRSYLPLSKHASTKCFCVIPCYAQIARPEGTVCHQVSGCNLWSRVECHCACALHALLGRLSVCAVYIPVSLLRTLSFLIFQMREDSALTLRMAASSCVSSVSLAQKPMAWGFSGPKGSGSQFTYSHINKQLWQFQH